MGLLYLLVSFDPFQTGEDGRKLLVKLLRIVLGARLDCIGYRRGECVGRAIQYPRQNHQPWTVKLFESQRTKERYVGEPL